LAIPLISLVFNSSLYAIRNQQVRSSSLLVGSNEINEMTQGNLSSFLKLSEICPKKIA